MQLAAISAGGQAPRGHFNGAVHSVFRQACNICLADGRMLALLAPQLGNLPHGVRLDAPTGFAFADHLEVDRPVGCRADVLRVVGGPSIDLGTAQLWRGELPPGGVDLSAPEVLRAWQAAWETLWRGRVGSGDNRPRLLAGRVDAEGLRLARAARRFHADEAACALTRLIGCGPGLTPSGDDLIVGFLAGLWSATGYHPARRALRDGLCAAAAAAAAATGDISRVYLDHATHGRFAEPLTTLARRIGEGADAGALQSATTVALRVGDTSGRAGAFGLLLGLAAWAPQSVLPRLARRGDVGAGPDPVISGSLRRDRGSPIAVDARVEAAAVRASGGAVGQRAGVPAACREAEHRDLDQGLTDTTVNWSFGWSMRPWPSVSPPDRFAGTDSQGRMDQRTRAGWAPMVDERLTGRHGVKPGSDNGCLLRDTGSSPALNDTGRRRLCQLNSAGRGHG